MVIHFIAPGIVHRHAGFPIEAGFAFGQYFLFRGAEVPDIVRGAVDALHALTAFSDAVVDEDVRFQAAHKLVEVFALGFVPFVNPFPVEPKNSRVVLCDQFPELGQHVLVAVQREALALGVGVMPVHDRVVEAEFDAGLIAGIFEFAQDIPFEGGEIHHVVVRHFGIPEAEAIVVFGGDDDIAHTRFFSYVHPLFGVEQGGVELAGKRFVVWHGDFSGEHDPLPCPVHGFPLVASGGHGIGAPVDEHAEGIVFPPGHAVFFFRFRLQQVVCVGALEQGDFCDAGVSQRPGESDAQFRGSRRRQVEPALVSDGGGASDGQPGVIGPGIHFPGFDALAQFDAFADFQHVEGLGAGQL